MNGIHEVRGSIPLVSTNSINKLGHRPWCPFSFLWVAMHILTRPISKRLPGRRNQPARQQHPGLHNTVGR